MNSMIRRLLKNSSDTSQKRKKEKEKVSEKEEKEGKGEREISQNNNPYYLCEDDVRVSIYDF